jgi:hypothetical protein
LGNRFADRFGRSRGVFAFSFLVGLTLFAILASFSRPAPL